MQNSTYDFGPPPQRVAVPIRPEAIAPTRRAVQRAAEAAGLGLDRIDDLLLAVSEAATNAVEEHLRAGVDEPVEVGCTTTRAWFEVNVRDRGRGFDVGAVPVREPLVNPSGLDVERGWGIQLMRELVDEVAYEVSADGTIVRLRVAR